MRALLSNKPWIRNYKTFLNKISLFKIRHSTFCWSRQTSTKLFRYSETKALNYTRSLLVRQAGTGNNVRHIIKLNSLLLLILLGNWVTLTRRTELWTWLNNWLFKSLYISILLCRLHSRKWVNIWFNDLLNLPSNDSSPHDIQMMKLMPTEPVRSSSPEGETNIPDPANNYLFVAIVVHILTCTVRRLRNFDAISFDLKPVKKYLWRLCDCQSIETPVANAIKLC